MALTQHKDRWTLTFVNVTGANAAPTTTTKNGNTVTNDTAIPIAGAKSISIQSDALTDANHTADDFDVNVITSSDGGSTFDDGTSNIYTSKNFAAVDLIGTFLATPGPTHMKVRVDENGALRADLIVYVYVTFE